MQRLSIIWTSLVVLATPASAANTPEALVQELSQAAHNGDEKGFLANVSGDTQRALAEADATRPKLVDAQRDFQTALDEHFGKSPPSPGSPRSQSTICGA